MTNIPWKAFAILLLAAGSLAQSSSWLTAKPGTPAGKVENGTIEDPLYNKPRRLHIYTPAGYDSKNKTAYPLLLVFDGDEYISDIPLPMILDNLIAAKKIPATVPPLIDNGEGTDLQADLANSAKF